MGTTERREREREEVRCKILDAAHKLFVQEGYEKVTMRRIAEAIEYSPTAIYHHFEDKDDVVQCLCERHFASLLHTLNAMEPPEDPVEGIRQLGRAYARFGFEHPNHYRFMFMSPDKTHIHKLDSPGNQTFALLHRVVERAIELGRFRPGPAETYAQVLWASLHGAVALSITYVDDQFPGGHRAADLIDHVLETGLRGLGAEPSKSEIT